MAVEDRSMLLSVNDINNVNRIIEYDADNDMFTDLQRPSIVDGAVDIKVRGYELVIKAVQGIKNVVEVRFSKLGCKTLPMEFKYKFEGLPFMVCSRVLTVIGQWVFYIGKDGEIVRTVINQESTDVLQAKTIQIPEIAVQLVANQKFLFVLTLEGTIYKIDQATFKTEARIELSPEGYQWYTIGAEGATLMIYGHKEGKFKRGVIKLLSQNFDFLDELVYHDETRQLFPYNEKLWVAVSSYKSIQLIDVSSSKIRLAGKPLFLNCTRTLGVVKAQRRKIMAFGFDLLSSVEISFTN